MSKLLLVYNTKSDLLNSAFDFAHKIISPSTYSCNLCKLTHGNFKEKKEWTEFVEKSNNELVFLHIDEFEKKYSKDKYPAVFKLNENKLEVVISPEELNTINSTEDLIQVLGSK